MNRTPEIKTNSEGNEPIKMSIADIETNNYDDQDYGNIAGNLNPSFGLKVKP